MSINAVITCLLVFKHTTTGDLAPNEVPDFLDWRAIHNSLETSLGEQSPYAATEHTTFQLTPAGEALAEKLPHFAGVHRGAGWRVEEVGPDVR